MPVNSTHASYRQFADRWMRCRDTSQGSDAVKARRTMYLPMLEGMSAAAAANVTIGIDPIDPVTGQIATGLATQSATGYDGYLARAMFYPAMGRTILGLIGLLFGKPPTPPKANEQFEKQFQDVTMHGQSLHGFAVEMAREVLTTGRVGVLVDYPSNPRQPDENRPYWLLYQTEDIVNWRMDRIGGRQLLTLVVLRETVEDFVDDDEFAPTINTRYRVLRLLQGASSLVYSVQLYEPDPTDKTKFIPQQPLIPIRRGDPLDFIPFQFAGPTTLLPEPEHPPLVDLADVDLSHYRTSADREHGAHFTALPTPWIRGHEIANGETLGMGSGTAWVLPNPQAEAGMLEFGGQGLASLKDLMEEKRLLMATLGARMLETQKNIQEAAQTVAMRHAGEGSALGIMSDTLGKALTNIVGWHLYWGGMERERIGEDQRVTLNPELLEQLTTEDISKLVAAWQAGAISRKTLYYNLQWGEWTRPDVDFDTELEDIKDEEEQDTPPELLGQPPALRAGDENLTPEERAAVVAQRQAAANNEQE